MPDVPAEPERTDRRGPRWSLRFWLCVTTLTEFIFMFAMLTALIALSQK